MSLSLVPPRSYEQEILDRPDNGHEDLLAAFEDIALINRRLGGIASLWRPLREIVERRGLRAFTLLDVGTGGGDVPRGIVRNAARLGISARAAGLDLDPGIVRLAVGSTPDEDVLPPRVDDAQRNEAPPLRPSQAARPLAVLRGDAFRLPFADESFDFVTSSLVAHHFVETDVSRLLAEMARVARCAALLNDLSRHLVPWFTIRALGIFFKSPMVRHDGPLSVLRGWTAAELLDVAREAGLADRVRIERRFPYRLVVIIERAKPREPHGAPGTRTRRAAPVAAAPLRTGRNELDAGVSGERVSTDRGPDGRRSATQGHT